MTSEQVPISPPGSEFILRVRFSRNTLFALIALLLIVGLLEAMARGFVAIKRAALDSQTVNCEQTCSNLCPYACAWNVEQEEALRYDVLLGTEWRPGYQGESLRINSLGFRGSEFESAKPPGAIRIVMVGGSAVLGAFVEDNETIPAYLEQTIRGQTSCEVEVINAGVTGYISTQELISLPLKILPLNPDILVIYDGRNDAFFATSPFWEPNYSPFMRRGNRILNGEIPNQERLRNRVGNWLVENSALASLISQAVRVVTGREGQLTAEQRAQLEMHPQVVEVYEYNLTQIGYLALANQVDAILVVQPLLGVGNKYLNEDERAILAIEQADGYFDLEIGIYPEMIAAAQRAGDRAGIPAYDYTTVFDGVSETVWADDVHLTPRGNQIVALRLLDDLQPLLATRGCQP